jgi:hypothetical protein
VGREDIHWIGPFCQDDLEDHFDRPIDFLHRPRKGLCQGIKLLSHYTNLFFFSRRKLDIHMGLFSRLLSSKNLCVRDQCG